VVLVFRGSLTKVVKGSSAIYFSEKYVSSISLGGVVNTLLFGMEVKFIISIQQLQRKKRHLLTIMDNLTAVFLELPISVVCEE
jgi:hypothetical protein